MLKIYDLKTEYLDNPMGIDALQPRFSWKIKSDQKNVRQISYHLIVKEGKKTVYDSGVVFSQKSQRIRYQGEPLKSMQCLVWKVTVCVVGDDGEETAEPEKAAKFEMGILDAAEWKAKWIEPEDDFENVDEYQPSPYLRKTFQIKSGLKKARIYQSAHGLYEFWINGKRGTKEVFKPGFTSYYKRIQYQTYDVTTLLEEGENVWAVELGDGWWRGISGGLFRNNFGYKLQFIGQLILEYEDGSSQVIISNESFKTVNGGLRMSDPKCGDIYDGRLEPKGWKEAGFDDSKWKPVHYEQDENARLDTLVPDRSVPVLEKERLIPLVMRDSNGDVVLDYGQNIAGYVKMRLYDCKKGQKITLQHSEDMKDGRFNMGNICMDMLGEDHYQQVDYIASGEKEEEYCPLFSVFGFRYVKVTGYEGKINPEDFIACAVYSACEETGDFTCSNPLINQLVSNSRWSQKGNFLDVPTDCPTRERSPWSGDSQVYAKTSTLFMNVYPFFEKWMYDLTLEQMPSGKVANTFPATNTMHFEKEIQRRRKLAEENGADEQTAAMLGDMDTGNIIDGSSGWGDTATITPYTMYLCYGDQQILANQYECAKKWVDYMTAMAKNPSNNPERLQAPEYRNYTEGVKDAEYVWDTCFHWGEWLEPDKPFDPSFLMEAITNPDPEVPTAFFAYSAHLVSEIAKILGKKEDAEKYAKLSGKIKRIFQKYMIPANGIIKKGRQAPNVRALQFGLVPPEKQQLVADKLDEMVRENDYHLNTGFLSTPFLLHQLAKNGHVETAFKVLEQTTSPSWLYPVTLGSTTILENWNALELHEYSYNHYSYGAVCDFLFADVAGIKPDIDKPGYEHFFIQPLIGGSLTEAFARYESIYGTITSCWKKTDTNVTYSFTIPENTTATIILSDGKERKYGSGTYDVIL